MEAIIFSLLLFFSNTDILLQSANLNQNNQDLQSTSVDDVNHQGYVDDTMVECSSGGKMLNVDIDGL